MQMQMILLTGLTVLSFAGDPTSHNGGNLELCARQAVEWNLRLYRCEPAKPVINLEVRYDTERKTAFNALGARSLGWPSWVSGAKNYTWGGEVNNKTRRNLHLAPGSPPSDKTWWLLQFAMPPVS